jgi:hypothetical protein
MFKCATLLFSSIMDAEAAANGSVGAPFFRHSDQNHYHPSRVQEWRQETN